MESLQKWVVDLNGVVWGPLMLVLILGTGLYLMLGVEVHAPGAPGSRLSPALAGA
ncbi:amino acid carrier protein [Pseudomonas aeruginosa]|nr:amino acid carrier protein [Pseudomonas aeruginosa]VTQ01616.1 amino acid carrier protein [Pseudomonas aeruginosa]